MCRWLIYLGDSICIHELLIEPNNSLLKQTLPERHLFTPGLQLETGYTEETLHLRNHSTNGDGFGIAWYRSGLDHACLYKSIQPAWNDTNLAELCKGLKTDLILAHVRAASPGLIVSRENCHPFRVGRYTFMHNGGINGFAKIRRAMRNQIRDDIESTILGTTDSEYAFALFLNEIPDVTQLTPPEKLRDALNATIMKIVAMTNSIGAGPSSLNFAVTDGSSIIATRFRNGTDSPPPSLYIAHGASFGVQDGNFRIFSAAQKDTIMISSEPPSTVVSDYQIVPPNALVMVSMETPPAAIRKLRKAKRDNGALFAQSFAIDGKGGLKEISPVWSSSPTTPR